MKTRRFTKYDYYTILAGLATMKRELVRDGQTDWVTYYQSVELIGLICDKLDLDEDERKMYL